MGEQTRIAWCDATFSPWWGCSRTSAACKNCYAAALAHRFSGLRWGTDYRFFGDKHWNNPLRWNRKAERDGVRRRVFPSMCDPFQRRPQLVTHRARLFDVIWATPLLDWLLLTKRPGEILNLVPESWCHDWPHNVHAGVTVENQATADDRIPQLMGTNARVTFLSCEPLLERIDLGLSEPLHRGADGRGVSHVIVGSESGPGARPMSEDWVRDIRDQCGEAGIAFLYKQRLDERGRKVELPELDGCQWVQFPGERT